LLAGCEGEPEPLELRVATINLRHDSDCWEERFALIGEEITALSADLIGMQEVEIAVEQAELLQGMARDAGLAYDFHQETKTGLAALSGEGIALFSRPSIVERSTIDLLYGRPAILDRIDLDPEQEGAELLFVNTHLHHQGGDEVRRPQMQLILDEIASETGPVILTGDLNAQPDSETLQSAYAAGFADAGEDAGNTSPIRLVKSATVAQNPRNRIDYILVRGPVEVREARLAFDRPAANGLYPSDHLGLVADVRVLP
jgi:endonuclease/exonuclease/phosphatase family metal-dependent hydrolase